ncbi:hypothetical protein MHW47_21090 [Streptomyces sp. OfavH-34-F]|uniref:hypothetical protein n=1 Tax=unclassified Streptomyces TaxID=2593676 RepID=UPI001EF3416E|nr:hypothetical protein [Streptomyces sp. OfavH-34-F]MCG7526931.1 hypothetical protein [Streptomyces sp. OfavH-34-F]
MPHLIQQLSADRALGGLRNVLVGCSLQAATLREGPARESGPGAAWLVFLCPAHCEDLPAWPAAATHPDNGSMPCGTVLDYRTAEQQLRSHADLWLTTLTGVDPQALGYIWSDVLDQADRVLLTLVEEAGADGEDSPLQIMLAVMGVACRAAGEGDLEVAAASLGHCETLVAQRPAVT